MKPVKLDNHHGRFLGCFVRRPSGAICFLLFIRTVESGSFDCVIAYYVNQALFKIPKSELEEFYGKLNASPRLGVARILTKLIKSCYPAALLHGIEVSIGLHLANNFRKLHIIQLNDIVPFESRQPDVTLPSCNIALQDEATRDLWRQIQSSDLVSVDYNCHGSGRICSGFDLLRARYKGHLYYGIHYKHERLLMILICHEAFFKSKQDTDDFRKSLMRGFEGDRPLYICASRFHSREPLKCTDKLILDACTKLRSFPMVVIKDVDVKTLVHMEGLDLLPKFGYDEPQLPVYEPIDDVIEIVDDIQLSQRSISSQIDVDGDFSLSGSCNTETYAIDHLREQISDAMAGSQSSASTIIAEYPEPQDDPTGELLHDVNFFLAFLRRVTSRIKLSC